MVLNSDDTRFVVVYNLYLVLNECECDCSSVRRHFLLSGLCMIAINQEVGNSALLLVQADGESLLAKFILKCFHLLYVLKC